MTIGSIEYVTQVMFLIALLSIGIPAPRRLSSNPKIHTTTTMITYNSSSIMSTDVLLIR